MDDTLTPAADIAATPENTQVETARELAEIMRQRDEILMVAKGYERAITQIPTQGTQEATLQQLLKDIVENNHFMLEERSKDAEEIAKQLPMAFGEKKDKLEELYEAHNRLIAAMQQFEIEMTSPAHEALAHY